jgi:drug/metabolite transporter (DMT)-like permease
MFIALLTALFFACSSVCARRSTMLLGPVTANLLRLSFAMAVLGMATLTLARVDPTSLAAQRLYMSGLAGFGLGDMAAFIAYSRLGSRLTMVLNLCLAPVFGAAGDWLLLGTALRPMHALSCAVILIGVCLSLRPRAGDFKKWDVLGLSAGVVAGMGMGLGATLSRYAKNAAAAEHLTLTSYNETLLRLLPAVLLVGTVWCITKWRGRSAPMPTIPSTPWRRIAPWVMANATFGTILGVTCFQWSLSHASSGLVLSITAMTPIFVMPLAAWLEGDQPSRISIIGAVIAVVGVVMLRVLA